MRKLFTSVVAVALLLALPITNLHAAKTVDKSNPEKVVRGFFDAEKSGDVELMKEYAKDTRFDDVATQTARYQNDFKTHPLVSYNIVNQKAIDKTHAEFTIQQTFKGMSSMPNMTFTAVNENGMWRVLLQEMLINLQPGSTDYGKVVKHPGKASSTSQKPSLSLKPAYTSVVYYSITSATPQGGWTDKGFTQTRQDGQLTINGWQDSNNGTPNMLYEVVMLGSSGGQLLSSMPVSGYYLQNGTWYSKYMQNVPALYGLTFRCYNNGTAYVDGAGNGYN